MCYGGIDLKHLARETESRLAGLPKVDANAVPRVGLFARLVAVMRAVCGPWMRMGQGRPTR